MQELHPNDITVHLHTITNTFEIIKEKPWFYNTEKQKVNRKGLNPTYQCYHLCYIAEGSLWHTFCEEKKKLIPQGAMFLSKIQTVDFLNTSCKLPMRYFTIVFYTWKDLPLDFSHGNIAVTPSADLDLENKFRAAIQLDSEKPFGWQMKLKNITTELLLTFFGIHFADDLKSKYPPALDKSLRIIREEVFTSQLAISDIAQRCGISTAYLIRMFNRYMNMTPKKYIDDLRLNRACELLKYTDKSVEIISEMSGFPEPRHMRRTLQVKTGMTPREYRRQP